MRLTDNSSQNILTAREVSRYLKIPLSTLYDLSRRGRILGVKVGKHWRYRREDVESYLSGSNSSFNISSHPTFSERRVFPRINCEAKAELKLCLERKGRIEVEGKIYNLSVTGALFMNHEVGKTLEPGDPVTLSFEMPAGPPITAEGRVVHTAQNGASVGIKFRNMPAGEERRIKDYVG